MTLSVTMPRRSFTKKEALAQFIAQDGKCNCGRCDGIKLQPGRIHEQHCPPYDIMKNTPGYDGKPSYLWTDECHKAITKHVDGPVIKKTRHMGGGKGSQVARRKNKSYRPLKSGKRKLQGPGFPTKEQRARAREWKQERMRDE